MHTVFLCSPGYALADKLKVPRVGTVNHQDGSGQYTTTYLCGCQFHGRRITSGPLAGHHCSDGREHRCLTHAVPDENDE